MINKKQHIRAIVFREESMYVSQCLEYYIATQADDLEILLKRLNNTIAAEFAKCAREDKSIEDWIAPCGQSDFPTLWDFSSTLLTTLNITLPGTGQSVEVDVKIISN